MPKVDLEELEKAQEKQEDDLQTIETKRVGDRTLFRGKHLGKDAWYSDYGECFNANQEAARQKSYKDQGLDESGRTPAAVALSAEKMKLIKKKNDLLEQAAKLDAELAGLRIEDFEKKAKK